MFFRKGFLLFFFSVFFSSGAFSGSFLRVFLILFRLFLSRVVAGLHNLCFLLCSLWVLSCLGAGRGAAFFSRRS